jgi:multiple sugar transport system substrate-binding protein
MRTRTFRIGSLVAAVVFVFSACGPAGTASSSPAAAPSGTAAAESSASTPPAESTAPGGVVELRWYCCLGGGEAPEQKTVEDKVVADFNASHPNIHVTFEVVTYDQANGQLTTEIQSGNGPDIVGPVGIGGANAFHGQWLDLAPLITKTNYDLSGFPANVVDIYKLDEGQVGIPFAIYPSALFYKKGMFEEAGLKEPPHKYGDQYELDGAMVDWNYDTAREVAKRLTVDKANKDATQAGFDPKKIAQWGLELQRDDLRGMGAYFGPGKLAADDGKTVAIPDAWKAAWKYYYDAMWTDHVSLTGPQFESKDINPKDYPFFNGNTAMSENFLWSTYGVADSGDDWDLAAIPSYNGTATAAFNADTFRILKDTKHPDEAFTFLTYLLGDASGELLKAYGGFPARTADQATGIAALQSQFTNTVDWQVAVDGIEHADKPNFEDFMPAYNESLGLVGAGGKYLTKWGNSAGLNMDQEIQSLQTDLQAIWDKAP